MARRRTSPYGTSKEGFVFDDRIGEFVNRRTGEIVSASDALPTPKGKTKTYRTGARSFDYKPPARKRFHGDHTLDIIRRQASRAPRSARIVVRAEGGTEEYEDEWWSSVPTDIEDLLDMNDDDLREFLYGLEEEDGPREIDIYIREEE